MATELRFHCILTFALATVVIGTASAQPTRRVAVYISGPCISSVPEIIGVVLNGDETKQFNVKKESEGIWTGDRPGPKTFDAATATASLRLAGARTPCLAAMAAKDEKPDTYLATFTFECNRQPVRRVEVGTEGPMPLSWVRVSGSCMETGHAESPPAYLNDVWFPVPVKKGRHTLPVPSEVVRLQLDTAEPKPKMPGLIVNDETVMQYENNGRVTLDLRTLLQAFGEQQSAAKAGMPPYIVPSFYDIERKHLADTGLEKLVLTVK
jgi:hypothetical protein